MDSVSSTTGGVAKESSPHIDAVTSAAAASAPSVLASDSEQKDTVQVSEVAVAVPEVTVAVPEVTVPDVEVQLTDTVEVQVTDNSEVNKTD